MSNLPENLDVIITFNDAIYQAKTPAFPHCKGKGATQSEALQKLSHSISNAIKKNTLTLLSEAFNSKNYSEIIIDPNNKEKLQHKIFNINKTAQKMAKQTLKLKFENIIEVTNQPENNIEKLLDILQQTPIEPHNKISEKNVSIIMGIQFSMN